MLSDTFKYISQFRHAGHQVGRKVGDMLELLTYSGMSFDSDLRARLNVEPKLFGFSDAGHKVEFVVHKTAPSKLNGGEIRSTEEILGFVECKKVGVEQTVNTSFKKKYAKNPNGQGFTVPYEEGLTVSFAKTNVGKKSFDISLTKTQLTVTDAATNHQMFSEPLQPYHRIIFAVFEDGSFEVINNADSLRSHPKSLKHCRIFDVYEIRDDCVVGVLNDCLSGPQTPEKAKQASFVALDVRKRRFNSFDLRADETELVSALVITEFSHWEQKSQNMITACIDYNLVVSDSLIVEAFIEFEAQFGASFYSFISKDNYEKNPNVKRIIDTIVAKHDGKIFFDIKDSVMKGFSYENEALTIS